MLMSAKKQMYSLCWKVLTLAKSQLEKEKSSLSRVILKVGIAYINYPYPTIM